MAPEPRPIPRFVAEPPHEGRPYGRWAESLARHFLEACEQIDTDEDLGEAAQVVWFPDRTFAGRTYIPASSTTSNGYELLGYVSYTREHEGAEARDFESFADFTDETAEANPDWELDLSDRELTTFNGGDNRRGARADDRRPVPADGRPVHARRPRQLHGRLPRREAVGPGRRRGGRRVALRRGLTGLGPAVLDLRCGFEQGARGSQRVRLAPGRRRDLDA